MPDPDLERSLIMMRSLFSGVSGLMNTQKKMDVIGNNVANVSTLAFKSSRVTFADAINQTLSSGSAPQGNNGGVNPIQIGLGMKVASIDTDFGQGILETSNMVTDLALEGSSFFIVGDGEDQKYTRAGAFQVDQDGYLVAQGGKYKLQGTLADDDGTITTGGALEDILIPFGQKSTAKATTEINYYANLNSEADAIAQQMTAGISEIAQTSNSADYAGATTFTAGDQYEVTLDGETYILEIQETATPATANELATVFNKAVQANSNLSGEIEAVVWNDSIAGTSGIYLRTTDKGGTDTSISLAGPSAGIYEDIADFGFAYETVTGTDTTTEINSLSMVSSALTNGDQITISGSNNDGTTVSGIFEYGTDGTTVQDLLNIINSNFSGSEATLNEKGEIVITDTIKGLSKASLSLGFGDAGDIDDSGSAVTLPSFTVSREGAEAGSTSSSVYVYDSLGNRHTVEITFTKDLAESNRWNWTVNVDGEEITPDGGASGKLLFNNNGSIREMSANDGQELTFDPGTGAETMVINLDPGTAGSFTGLTQYGSPFTTIAYEQDGYTMGTLDNIIIDEAGTIIGEYTNGEKNNLAQLALADFKNEQGLLKTGDNFYTESVNSGQAAIGYAGTDTSTLVRSGYLEGSNVDLNKELTDMIITQRSYQAQAKVISTSDTLLNDLLTKVKR